ncbi:uncharacterized protein [Triticum aestivum]|uniref:uncharacterized protein n=1 Tax=Triticum aestivum TaxID=4565 RepID=UPI001D035E2B|nr:uncharacterized protein LOC123076313 [Triticum aestivum]
MGARPRRLPFHAVSARPRRSAVSSVSASFPQQAPGPGNGDDANGPTGVPMPFSRESAITLPRPLTITNLMGEASGEGLRHVVLQTHNVQLSGSLCHAIKSMGSPIICCSKSDKSKEECARSNSIINGKLNKMNHTGEEPPRRSNSSVQVERWASSTLLATRTYEATIGSLGGPDANMPMRLRATNRTINSRFCRIQRVAKAGWLIDADYCGPVGSVLFNDSEVDLAVKTGDRVARMIIQMFTIVSMNASSVKDGSVT